MTTAYSVQHEEQQTLKAIAEGLEEAFSPLVKGGCAGIEEHLQDTNIHYLKAPHNVGTLRTILSRITNKDPYERTICHIWYKTEKNERVIAVELHDLAAIPPAMDLFLRTHAYVGPIIVIDNQGEILKRYCPDGNGSGDT